MTSWVPEGELLGQGSICPGPCLRWPWKVSVPGDPTGGCKKRPCLKFSLEQEDLKLRQLLDYLFLVSHVSWDLRSPRGYYMGPPNQTKGSPEPFSRGLRGRAGDSGQARLFRPFPSHRWGLREAGAHIYLESASTPTASSSLLPTPLPRGWQATAGEKQTLWFMVPLRISCPIH